MDGGRWGGGSAASPFLRSIIVTAFSIQGWQGHPFALVLSWATAKVEISILARTSLTQR